MKQQPCPAEDHLRDYCVGNLEPSVWDDVAGHVDGCAECQTAVAAMDDTADSLARELRSCPPVVADNPEVERLVALVSARREDSPHSEHDTTGAGADEFVGHAGHVVGAGSVLGQYHLLEKLGEGGMGVVYRAEHLRLKRAVAVKVLSQKRFSDSTAAARFQREIEALGQLHHPHIVNATDAGDADGTLYLVMESVDGIDLSRLAGRVLSVPDACELIRQAALGLQHAHESGFIHRDIKPSNLMLARDAATGPVVKILDLGLARLCHDEEPDGELTGTGQVMGTADYMPPEQFTGSQPVDIRSDLYSLGCTLYRLLAGHAPFTVPEFRTAFERMRAHADLDPAPLDSLRPGLPPALGQIMTRLLAKSPDDRFQTPIELAEALAAFTPGCDLQKLLEDGSSSANFDHTLPLDPPQRHPASAEPVQSRPHRRFRLLTGAAAACLTVLFGLWLSGAFPRVNTPNDGLVFEVDPGAAGNARPPVSSLALVQRPVALKGVSAWTIETIEPRGAIRDMAFQPGSKLLATAGDDGSIRLWKAESVQLQAVLVGHDGPVQDIEWSPDGRRLASTSSDGTIRLWETRTGRVLQILKPSDPVEQIAWSPDGSQLASRSKPDVVLWDTESGKRQQRLTHENSVVLSCDWSADGQRLVTGGADQRIHLWNTKTGRQVDSINGHEGAVLQTRWSPDDRFLVSAGADNRVIVWEYDEGWQMRSPHQSTRPFTDAAWSPDGTRLVACSKHDNGTGQLAVWSVESREWTTSPLDGGTLERVLWAPDSRRVALTASVTTSAVQVHRIDGESTRREYTEFQRWQFGARDEITCVAWSHDGKWLASGGLASIAVRNAESGQVHQEIFSHPPLGGVKWSPHGDAIAARHANKTDDYDRDNRRHAETVEIFVWRGGESPKSSRLSNGKGQWVNEIAWSPGGEFLAAGGARLHVWNVRTEKSQTLGEQTGKGVIDLEWSPSGDRLAAGRYEGLEIWNPATGDRVSIERKFPGNEVVWTPDSRFLLVPAGSATHVFDVESGKQRAPSFPGNSMRAPVLHPDGDRLAVSTGPGRIALFDFHSGDALPSPPPGSIPVTVLKWSPDGELLYSLRDDGTLAGWSPEQNRTILRSRIPAAFGAFSPDARSIACAVSNDIRIVHVATAEPQTTLIALRDGSTHFIMPDGRTTIGQDFDRSFVYVALTTDGQQTLTSAGLAPAKMWNTEPFAIDLLLPDAE